MPLAAVVLGIAWSTAGVEIVAQAVVVGAVLAWRGSGRRAAAPRRARSRSSLGLAAPVVLTMSGLTAGTARAGGFVTDARAQPVGPPVHVPADRRRPAVRRARPRTRSLVGRQLLRERLPLHPEPLPRRDRRSRSRAAASPDARPGACGSRCSRWWRSSICLGRFARLGAPLVDQLPAALRAFRFPTKAFFTVHLVVALLAAWGLEALAAGHRRARAVVAALALGAGGVLVLAPALPRLMPRGHGLVPGATSSPTALGAAARARTFDGITVDAALGGGVAVVLGLIALAARPGLESGRRLALLAAGLAAGDLLRTGAGLNPMIEPGFFRQSAAGRRGAGRAAADTRPHLRADAHRRLLARAGRAARAPRALHVRGVA